MAKLTEVEKDAIKVGLELWIEGFQAEIQEIEDQGKTPIFSKELAKTWPESIKQEILIKLKIQ